MKYIIKESRLKKIINEGLIDDIKHFFEIASPEMLEKDIVKKLKDFYEKNLKFDNITDEKDLTTSASTVNNKTIDKGTFIIDKGNSSFSFTILFGGTPSSTYGASKMKKDAGDELKGKNIIYSNWENTVDSLKDSLKKEYPEGVVEGIVGFSKGGLRAWPATEGNYKFVGLIDPSIEGDYKSANPTVSNIKMTYLKNRTWGLNGLKFAVGKLGSSNVIPMEGFTHEGMVSEFVKKFKDYF